MTSYLASKTLLSQNFISVTLAFSKRFLLKLRNVIKDLANT